MNVSSPHKAIAEEMESRGHKIVKVNYQPTSEMMIVDFAEKINAQLPKQIKLHSLKLRETETAFAQWFAKDN